jgi:hypothetical protein
VGIHEFNGEGPDIQRRCVSDPHVSTVNIRENSWVRNIYIYQSRQKANKSFNAAKIKT